MDPRSLRSNAALLAYLSGVALLSAGIVGLLYASFVSGYPSLLRSFFGAPVRTVSANPLGLLVLASVPLAIVVLFGLVVVFGARYGRFEPETPPDP